MRKHKLVYRIKNLETGMFITEPFRPNNDWHANQIFTAKCRQHLGQKLALCKRTKIPLTGRHKFIEFRIRTIREANSVEVFF